MPDRHPEDPRLSYMCPVCKTPESYKVTVTDSGSCPDEWGTCHWFEGHGLCDVCGWEDYVSDSDH